MNALFVTNVTTNLKAAVDFMNTIKEPMKKNSGMNAISAHRNSWVSVPIRPMSCHT